MHDGMFLNPPKDVSMNFIQTVINAPHSVNKEFI